MASALGFAYLNIVIVFLSFSISSAKAETLYVTSVAADYGYNASYEWIAKVPSLGDTDPTTVTTTPGVFWGTISPSSAVVDICQYIWDKEYIKFPIWIIPSNNASQESQRVHNMSVQVEGCIRQAGVIVDAAQIIFNDTQTGKNLTAIIVCLEHPSETNTCEVYSINTADTTADSPADTPAPPDTPPDTPAGTPPATPADTTLNGKCLEGSADGIARGLAFLPCVISILPKKTGTIGKPCSLKVFAKTTTKDVFEGCAKSVISELLARAYESHHSYNKTPLGILREKLLDMAIDIITNGTAFIRGINTGLVILLMALSLYWLL